MSRGVQDFWKFVPKTISEKITQYQSKYAVLKLAYWYNTVVSYKMQPLKTNIFNNVQIQIKIY